MSIDANKLLEMFGLRTADVNVEIREGKNAAAGKLLLTLNRRATNQSLVSQAAQYGGVAHLEVDATLTAQEARYLAERLNAMAAKVEKKAKDKRPCDSCGK